MAKGLLYYNTKDVGLWNKTMLQMSLWESQNDNMISLTVVQDCLIDVGSAAILTRSMWLALRAGKPIRSALPGSRAMSLSVISLIE